MPLPAEAPFNPKVSAVPSLDASSGNPNAYKDPKSVASMGLKLQAMTDQSAADTLYDPPPPPRDGKEGFQVQKLYKTKPWITQTEACRKTEGFQGSLTESNTQQWTLLALAAGAAGLLICSFIRRK